MEDLDLYESTRDEFELAGITPHDLYAADMAQAQEFMRRVKYHRAKVAEVTSLYEGEIARLQHRMSEAVKPYLRRERYYTAALEAFAIREVGNRKRDKTVKLPDGDLAVSNQQSEWVWNDVMLAGVVQLARPELVTEEVVLSVNRADVKRLASVTDGKAYLADGNGELIELPVTVTERPPRVTITIA